MAPSAATLRTTPLHQTHCRLGARMVEFGGWNMPVQYSGILEEHRAVRTRAGLFDVSHMGRIVVRGREAGRLIDTVTAGPGSALKPGQARYSALLYDHGGFVDDILVHKIAEDHFFLCVNASNQDKDYQRIAEHNTFDAVLEIPDQAQLAIQGPFALAALQKLTPVDLSAIGYYHFVHGGLLCGVSAEIARTGYTGEDGFEVYIPSSDAPRIWDMILEAGAEFGIQPCGLGARNTLRLEAAMALYGHEIDASTTPFDAGLGWIVDLKKTEFLGRDALVKQKQRGVTRRLTGFEMKGRGIGRDGYEVLIDGVPMGWVTSGGPAPTLNKNIGLCYLPQALSEPGRTMHVMVRGTPVEAVTVATPFYKRGK
jgi:aminomethyltransferase